LLYLFFTFAATSISRSEQTAADFEARYRAAHNSSDALEILWRKVDLTYQEEHELSARLWAKQLKKLMKERSKR
jgi:hypothetical protein